MDSPGSQQPSAVPRSPLVRLATRRVALSVLLLVAASAVFTALGLWQYDGWVSQRAAEQRDLTSAPAVAISTVIGADDPFPAPAVGRPVEVSGEWVPDSGFVVGPRSYEGRDGWWSVAALSLSDEPAAVPVVLGWSPRPVPPTPTGSVDLVGFLQPGEGSAGLDRDLTDRELPSLRLASITQLVPEDLLSAFVVVRTATPPTALPAVAPDQVPAVGASTALRNLLYALQWWLFVVFAVVAWVRFVREELARE